MNFGDDLNVWLWPRLFPFFFSKDTIDHLVGIGTILSDRLPKTGRLFIMGSGAGYARLPPPDQRKHWDTIFVRGPLTARVLGLPATKAITDGAYLAADLFSRPSGPARGGLFIPHWKSDLNGDWATVCNYAGLRHVSPMQPVDAVLSAIAGAEVVLTESMHGAILADALRVPWIAVRTSPEINDFKWIDWCMSVGETYEPYYVPPSSIYDSFRQERSRRATTIETFSILDEGIKEPGLLEDRLMELFRSRFDSNCDGATAIKSGRRAQLRNLLSAGMEEMTRYAFRWAQIKPSVGKRDREIKERSAIALAGALGQPWKLSKNDTHAKLMEALLNAVAQFSQITQSV